MSNIRKNIDNITRTKDVISPGDRLPARDDTGDFKITFENLEDSFSAATIIPKASIIIFAGAIAPDGWLLCDGSVYDQIEYADLFAVIGSIYDTGGEGAGNFRVPDFQGIFPKGAGSHHSMTKSDGNAFTGVLGTYDNDMMQKITGAVTNASAGQLANSFAASGAIVLAASGLSRPGYSTGDANSKNMTIDSSQSANARTGVETKPANLGINFIIKH